MTKIPTTPPEPGSARHLQRDALAVAIALTSYDLPRVYDWSVTDDRGLKLQLWGDTDNDAITMADLHTWATFLGDADGPLHIHTKSYSVADGLRVWIKGTHTGVNVEVWNSVANPAVPATAPLDCVHDCDEDNCANEDCSMCPCCGVPEAAVADGEAGHE